MASCPNCGHQVNEGDQFCQSCGEPLKAIGEGVHSPATEGVLDASDAERTAARMKRYTWPAVLVLLLYLLFLPLGLIANWLYYRNAKRMSEIAGDELPGTGCLKALLVFGIILSILLVLSMVVGYLILVSSPR